MANYVIGDIQGCLAPLEALLAQIGFNPSHDILWCTGDLVNRGPMSLEVLQFFKQLDTRARVVLGNHDLHLLAVAAGNHKHLKAKDTLAPILSAPNRGELLEWLRHQPLLIHDAGVVMIHAGLPPQWDFVTAKACASEVEATLQGKDFATFVSKHLYGNKPDVWSQSLDGWERIRFITTCFTRLRYCTLEGRLSLKKKYAPEHYDDQELPWYAHPQRQTQNHTILFGHWSTLGLRQTHNIVSLDTGCLWGGQLTALRLEDWKLFQYPCKSAQNPHDFS